jgi:hypothetical protein
VVLKVDRVVETHHVAHGARPDAGGFDDVAGPCRPLFTADLAVSLEHLALGVLWLDGTDPCHGSPSFPPTSIDECRPSLQSQVCDLTHTTRPAGRRSCPSSGRGARRSERSSCREPGRHEAVLNLTRTGDQLAQADLVSGGSIRVEGDAVQHARVPIIKIDHHFCASADGQCPDVEADVAGRDGKGTGWWRTCWSRGWLRCLTRYDGCRVVGRVVDRDKLGSGVEQSRREDQDGQEAPKSEAST